MFVHVIEHRRKPVVTDSHITVEKHYIRIIHRLDSAIIPLGKAEILAKLHYNNRRELLTQQFQRTVGAAIVSHHHISHPFGCVLHYGRKETTQHRLPVPVKYDYGYRLTCVVVHYQNSLLYVSSVYGSTAISTDCAVWWFQASVHKHR